MSTPKLFKNNELLHLDFIQRVQIKIALTSFTNWLIQTNLKLLWHHPWHVPNNTRWNTCFNISQIDKYSRRFSTTCVFNVFYLNSKATYAYALHQCEEEQLRLVILTYDEALHDDAETMIIEVHEDDNEKAFPNYQSSGL